MKCPRCKSTATSINDSRKKEGIVKRVRWCKDCRTTFNTIEVLENYDNKKLIAKLWLAIEDGTIDENFFELRGEVRKLLHTNR